MKPKNYYQVGPYYDMEEYWGGHNVSLGMMD